MVTFQYWTNGHIIPGLTVTSWSCWGLFFLFFFPHNPMIFNVHLYKADKSSKSSHFRNCNYKPYVFCFINDNWWSQLRTIRPNFLPSWSISRLMIRQNRSLLHKPQPGHTASGAISGRTGPAWHAFNALLSKMVACSSATLTCWNDCSQ